MMVPTSLYPLRQELLDAFHPDDAFYYPSEPHAYQALTIDGMAWTSLLMGAAQKVGDVDMVDYCVRFNGTIMNVAPNARIYAPLQVREDWKRSEDIWGMWYYEKPQSFAGPAALYWARNQGVEVNGKWEPSDPTATAKLFVSLGWFFGHLVKWVGWLEQHINSMFLAHLLLDKRPAGSMMWLCEGNPFFSYIAGRRVTVEYPDPRRYINGETVYRGEIVPLNKRKPSSWIYRVDPRKEYVDVSGEGYGEKAYTRIWQLTAEYLQTTLG